MTVYGNSDFLQPVEERNTLNTFSANEGLLLSLKSNLKELAVIYPKLAKFNPRFN